MAHISTLTETWDSGIGAAWNNWGGAPYVTTSGGDLRLTNNPASTNFYGLSTAVGYDWVNGSASIRLKSLPVLDNVNDNEYSSGVLNVEVDANNRYYWSWEGNQELACLKVVGGSYQWKGAISNPNINGAHKYVRIRFSADGLTAYWEYSADYVTWNIFAQEATTGVSPANLYLSIANGNWATVAGTYVVLLGGVNVSEETTTTTTTTTVSPTANKNMLLMF